MSRRAPVRRGGGERATHSRGARSRHVRESSPLWRRIRWQRALVLAVLAVVLLFLLLVTALYAFADIPRPNDIARVQSVRVLDREGRSVGRIAAEADRVSIPLAQMPAHLQQAVIATEDRRFYRHPGVRVTSIVRAAFVNLVGGGIQQGGSTITQQYVKNAFVGNERSFMRKSREAVLSLKIERRRSKRQILEDYLNTIYFGRGAYGVQAAARAYFGKGAKELTVPESAMLAGLIKSPEAYDPTRDPDAAKARRDLVIGFMVRDGYLSENEEREARESPVRALKRKPGGVAPHFLEDVRRVLEEEVGEHVLYEGGVIVRSTLDLDMQRAAEKSVGEVWPSKNDPEVALVGIDPKTGAVRALVGSRNFSERPLNIASRSRRQPGSTFKPAVLAAAIEEGIGPRTTFRAPAKIDIPGYPKPIHNYDGRDYGTIDVVEATANSVNTVYAQLIKEAGAANVVDIAHRMGIRAKLDPIVGLALGVNEVSPLELTSMFATLGARGEYSKPYLVERVERRGKVIFRAEQSQDRAVETETADVVNEVLQRVVSDGTGARAEIGRPTAGKTGTTQENVDAWFAGYTPDLAAVVWNGFPDRRKSLKDFESDEGCVAKVGGSCPAEIWKRFMLEALEGVPPTPFADAALTGGGAVAPETDGAEPETEEPSESPSPSSTPRATSSPTAPALPTETKKPKPTKSPSASPSPSPSPTDEGEIGGQGDAGGGGG